MKPDAASRKVGQVVEALVDRWENVREGQPQARRIHMVHHEDFTIDYVSISREFGSGGREVADELSKLLDWQVYDKRILNYMSYSLS